MSIQSTKQTEQILEYRRITNYYLRRTETAKIQFFIIGLFTGVFWGFILFV